MSAVIDRFVVLCLCLLMLPGLSAAQDCTLNGVRVDPSNGNTTAGKTGLMRCQNHDSGQLMQEKELKNGKFEGLDRAYQNGKLLRESTINANGNRQGRMREFAPSGQIVRDGLYQNGTMAGLQQSFYRNGQLQRATFYNQSGAEQAFAEFNAAGQLQQLHCGAQPLLAPAADDAHWCGFSGGPSKLEFFRDGGALRARGRYLAGKRILYETLGDNGQPTERDEVVTGLRTERRFFTDGGLQREMVWREQGKTAFKEREKNFAASGALERERHWSDGNLVSDQTFYLNGQPRSKSEFGGANETAWRQTIDYYDNGKVEATGRFSETDRYRSTPVGTQQRFNQAGTLVAESVYDARGHLNREKTWDEKGMLLRDDAVFEDGSRKAFSR